MEKLRSASSVGREGAKKQRSADHVVMDKSHGVAYFSAFLKAFFRQVAIRRAVLISFPAAALSALLKYADQDLEMDFLESWLPNDNVIRNVSFILGFFAIFHTSHSYERLTNGAEILYSLRGDLYDMSSLLFSYTRPSSAGEEKVSAFCDQLVRLASLLFSVGILELDEDGSEEAANGNLIDVQAIGDSMLQRVVNARHKKEVVGNMIKSLIVQNVMSGVLCVPPPLLSPVLKELSMVASKFSAVKTYKEVSFPFPFVATSSILLLITWCVTPFFVARWSAGEVGAALYTFVAVATLLMLNGIARELDNPFGTDVNDIDMKGMQEELNQRLVALLKETEDARGVSEEARRNTNRVSARYPQSNGLSTMSFNQLRRSHSPKKSLIYRQQSREASSELEDGAEGRTSIGVSDVSPSNASPRPSTVEGHARASGMEPPGPVHTSHASGAPRAAISQGGAEEVDSSVSPRRAEGAPLLVQGRTASRPAPPQPKALFHLADSERGPGETGAAHVHSSPQPATLGAQMGEGDECSDISI